MGYIENIYNITLLLYAYNVYVYVTHIHSIIHTTQYTCIPNQQLK